MGRQSVNKSFGIANRIDGKENFLLDAITDSEVKSHGLNFPPFHISHFITGQIEDNQLISSVPHVDVADDGSFITVVKSEVDSSNLTVEGYSNLIYTRRFGLFNKPPALTGGGGGFDRKRVSPATVSLPGQIKSISINVENNDASSHNIRGVIYEDDNGVPGALFASSNQISVPGNTLEEWVTGNFSGAYADKQIPVGNYWIGAHTEDNEPSLQWRSESGVNVLTNSDTYSNGPSDPFGSPSQTDDVRLYCYVTYQPDTISGQPRNYIFNRRADG